MPDTIPQDTPEKQCTKCGKFFPPTFEFFPRYYKRGKIAMRAHCLICERAITNAKYRAKHPKECLEENQKRCTKCKEIRLLEEFPRDKNAKDDHSSWCKICYKEWRDTHPEWEQGYRRPYLEKNKEHIQNRRKRVYQENKEEIKATNNRHYHANKEQARAADRRYRQTPHGNTVRRAAHQKRKALKKALEVALTAEQIQVKLKAQKYACYYCFQKFEKRDKKYVYHLEHTIPVSRAEENPKHDINYVVLACPDCNMRKKNRLPHEWPEGGRLF